MRTIIFAAAAVFAVASSAFAETPKPVQQNNSNAVWFENWQGLSNATWTIAMPDGEIIQIFTKQGTPVFQLEGSEVLDGIYRYELTAATEEKVKIKNQVNNGRGDAARDFAFKPFAMSGAFHVQRGVIVVPEMIKEEEG